MLTKSYNLLLKDEILWISNKLILYNASIRPTLTYVCPILGFACKTSINYSNKSHDRSLRTIRRDYKYLRNATIHRDWDSTSLTNRINHLAKNVYKYVSNILYEINAELPDYEVLDSANRKWPRYSILLEDDDWVFSTLLFLYSILCLYSLFLSCFLFFFFFYFFCFVLVFNVLNF